MAAGVSADLLRSFFELRKLNTALHVDTDIALDHLRDAALSFNAGPNQETSDEANFWCKAAIRSFMTEVDSIGYVMRRTVLQNADKGGLSLTKRERARLMERRYDAETDCILEERQALLAPEEGFKIGVKYFALLFGSDFVLNTSGEAWRGFKVIVRVRNNMTHPKIPEHLGTFNALPPLYPSLEWFYGELLTLFRDVASRTGASVPEQSPINPAWPPFRESKMPWRDFFSDADHQLIMESGSRTLEYVKLLFDLLHKDVVRAMDLCKGSFDSFKTLRSPEAQFAHRAYLRTLFSSIEGHISAARFFLEAAMARGTVHLTNEEQASLREGEVEDRLASAMTLWEREFGADRVAPRNGAHWVALKAARELRNRITHPRKTDNLEITIKHAGNILSAQGYLTENMNAFTLNVDKWMEKAGNIGDVIEQEQAAANNHGEGDGAEEVSRRRRSADWVPGDS